MKILQIQFGVSSSTTCLRLKHALEDMGHEVRIITLNPTKAVIEEVTQIRLSFLFKVYRKVLLKFINTYCEKKYPNRKKGYFSYGIEGIPYRYIKKYILEADVVHINWALMLLNYKNMSKLIKNAKKVVWTTHDCWAFSGGCHYVPYGCEGYKRNCGNCQLLNSNASDDLSRFIINQKKKAFDSKIVFIGPSKWISEKIKESYLFKNNRVVTIPNAISCDIYKVMDRSDLRGKYNIPHDAKVMMVGAFDMSSPYKGYENFENIVGLIKSSPDRDNYFIVTVGNMNNIKSFCGPIPVLQLGYIDSEVKMAEIYNLADVFLLTSTYENLPTVVLESMACGTPVTAFNVGGLEDMVAHKVDGYLASPFDEHDFFNGIKWCLENGKVLRNNMHDKMKDYCSYPVVAQKHYELYLKI